MILYALVDHRLETIDFVTATPKPRSIAVDDLNGNGKPDLVAANSDGDTVSVLLNRGDGRFQAKRGYRTGSHPFAVALGDLNGDRTTDVVTANAGPLTVSVLLNRGDGSLRTKLDYAGEPDYDGLGPIAIGDLNGDRRRDLAAVVVSRATASIVALEPPDCLSRHGSLACCQAR